MAFKKSWILSFGILFMVALHVGAKGGRGGGGSRSSSSSSRSSWSSSSSSSYSRPTTSSWSSSSYNYKPSTSSSYGWTNPSTSSLSKPYVSPTFATPRPSAGFVAPKPSSSSAGFVTPKPSSSSAGFVTPKPSTSSAGFVTPRPASSSTPGFVQPQPPYNPSFNPSAPIQPSLNKPYPVQPHTTVYNNNYLPNSGPQQIQPPIYQQPYVTNVIHKNKYNTPIVPIIIPFTGSRSFHSSGHYHRHYGWDSSEERYGYNREPSTVHHHHYSGGESRLIKTENSLTTSSEGPKYKAVLYQHSNYEGNKLDVSLSLGECVDLPRKFNDEVSSLETKGNCVMLCENTKCNGECVQFGQNSVNSGKWVGNAFNDKASSMIICNPVPENLGSDGARAYSNISLPSLPVQTGSIIFATPDDVSQQIVTLYTEKNYTGEALQLAVGPKQCSDVPTLFNDETSSVDVHGKCFILCEHHGCTGDCYNYNSTSECLLYVGIERDNKISSAKLC